MYEWYMQQALYSDPLTFNINYMMLIQTYCYN